MSTESGMVLVPREPTDEMIRAFIGIQNECANYYWNRCDGITSSYAERYARMIAAAPASPPTPTVDGRTLCGWTEDADGIWESDCGQTWSFVEGGPHDNRCAFCNKCGKPLDIVAYVEEKETEE